MSEKKARGVRKLLQDPYKLTPRVIDTPGAQLRVERGRKEWLDSDRVAVVCSWTPGDEMSLSLSKYLEELSQNGYVPLVVSTAETDGPLLWPHGIPDNAVVVRRDNVGYDFGSYSAVLNALPHLRNIDHLLLTNDSLVGPFAPIGPILRQAEVSSADICSLTESQQYVHHPQSFFLMFRKGVLDEKPMRRFFDEVREQGEKVQIIQAYELGLSRHCAHEGYSWESIVGSATTNVGTENPTYVGWRSILDAGVPFLKRNILLDPTRTRTTEAMPVEVLKRYGQDVREWLPEGYILPDELEDALREVEA